MTDWLSPEQRSWNMASIRSAGNKSTEQRLAKILRDACLTGWRRHLPLPGKPDFAFRSEHIAIFVDGCFWHGCPRCYRLPEDNRQYWQHKVATNRKRDRRADRELREKGWLVLRVWEHMLKTEQGRSRLEGKLKKLFRISAALKEA